MNELAHMLNELMRQMLFLPEQASTFAKKVDFLHYFVIVVTMLSSTLVGLLAVSFFFKYRETKRNA
jgi:cytochrome c oxidase subunit II